MTLSANQLTQPHIFVLHENAPWVEPLRREFGAIDAPFSEWFLDRGLLDLTSAPPEGVFYNRMSASSHTRGHRYAPEYTAAVLAWLKRHGRTVVNGERALQLEISKVAQYASLDTFGIETPATIAAIGREHLSRAASAIGYPIILKHNRAGKGLGVKLIYSEAALNEHIASDAFEDSVDGLMLVQRSFTLSGSTPLTASSFALPMPARSSNQVKPALLSRQATSSKSCRASSTRSYRRGNPSWPRMTSA